MCIRDRAYYEGLYGFNQDLVLVPLLAESHEVSSDGLVYTFKLRQGVKFHDGKMCIRDRAIAAARFNPDLKRKYEALIAAGKEKKVALTAIMRKIIVMANALIRDRRRWTTSHA